MPLKLRCPSCHRSLRVPSQQAGQAVRCPKCGSTLTAPAQPPEAAAKNVRRGGGQPVLSTLEEPKETSTPASGPPPLRGRSLGPPPKERPPLAVEPVPPPPVPPPLRSDAALAETPPTERPPLAVEPVPPPPVPPPPAPPPLRSDAALAETPPAAPPPAAAPPIPPSPGTSPVLPQAPADRPLPGVEHTWIRRWPVYQLGMWVIVAAVVGVIPALLDIVAHIRQGESAGISRWALALLLASGLQAVYAVYLLQLPDWGTAWVMSIVMLVFATGYAALLGALTLANQQSQLVQFLELGDMLPGGQAAIWCLTMLCIYSLLAYFSGRISFRWRRIYWRWAGG